MTTRPASSAGRMISSTICARLAMYSSISERSEIDTESRSSRMLPKPIAECRAAGVAAGDDVEPLVAEPIRQPGGLRRLPAPVRPVQDQEKSRMRMRFIRLFGHARLPSSPWWTAAGNADPSALPLTNHRPLDASRTGCTRHGARGRRTASCAPENRSRNR